ncbi:uncharacterized protein PAC_03508 [Phialocephala subalpina]|uniref:Extracellular membrane protein CFEM domain-containing protein n=1 Tax=Phialocephala subalpina TaxID=576137 RepID=A0A1L7WLI5_9HELO|nr:uncharacterized protein PAC_03508 [Phialocephala subalpina]
MKVIKFMSLLFAALSSFPFVFGSRLQARDVPIAGVVACANNANCTAARTDLSDCFQNAQSSDGHTFDDITNCLCVFGRGAVTPWHPDWTDQLESCIVCVENAAGLNSTVSQAMQVIIGVQNSFGGLCKRTLDLGQMVRNSEYLAYVNNFPLSLPDATLRNNSAAAKRDIITLTKISLVSVTRTTRTGAFSLPSMGNPNTLTATVPIVTPFLSQSSSSFSSLQASELKCNHDNCLRQCIRESSAAADFCLTYTKSVYTTTLGLPDIVSHCDNDPTRISSACSCLATVTAASTPSSHTTSSRTKFSSTPSSSAVSSLSSTISSKSTSSSSSSKLSLKTTTSSRTSSSTTPSTSGWVTLPPSDAMKACAASTECFSAGSIFNTCIAPTSGIDVWNCFCVENHDEWYKWVTACTACVHQALPISENGALTGGFVKDQLKNKIFKFGQYVSQTYECPIACFNMTLVDAPISFGGMDPPTVSVSITGVNSATIVHPGSSSSKFATAPGSSTPATSKSSSTTQFKPASSQGVVPASTTTLKSTVKSTVIVTVVPVKSTSASTSPSTTTSTSSGIKLKPSTTPSTAKTTQASSSHIPSSSTSTSAPSTPLLSSPAFPISPQMQACQFSKTTCKQAGMIFTECINSPDPTGTNTTTWDCLCTTNFAQWNSTLNSCSDCISKALPQVNHNSTWQASQVPQCVNLEVSTYCSLKGTQQGSRDAALINGGRLLTSAFQSPILWFNMTAIDAPIAWPPVLIA